jgi:hypothetical protein
MTRTPVLLAMIVVSSPVLVAYGVLAGRRASSDAVAYEKFARIREGMTRAEVEMIIGAPPTLTHDGKPPWPVICTGVFTPPPESTCGAEWDDGRHIVQVGFGDTDRVTESHFWTKLNQFESFLEDLRWWFDEQCQRLLPES